MTQERQSTLDTAYLRHPERFVRGAPKPPAVPTATWINKPKADSELSEYERSNLL